MAGGCCPSPGWSSSGGLGDGRGMGHFAGGNAFCRPSVISSNAAIRARSRLRPQSSGATAGAPLDENKAAPGFQFPLKAAVTSGILAMTGDGIGQGFQMNKRREELPPCCRSNFNILAEVDFVRLARMLSYGFLIYGPLSYYWYQWLDSALPTPGFQTFLAKVALNQVVLGPIVVVCVFSYNFLLMGKAADIPEKLRTSMLPTMIKGWKFWIPAALINFSVIPLPQRVLYMSSCAVVWNTILSLMTTS